MVFLFLYCVLYFVLCIVGIDEVLRVSELGVWYRAWSILYVLWRLLVKKYPVERL